MLVEEGDGARPGVAGGLGVVSRAGIVVEGVAHTLVDVDTEDLLAGDHFGDDSRHTQGQRPVGFRVHSEYRRLDCGKLFDGGGRSIKRNRGAQFGNVDDQVPGIGAAGAEAEDTDAVEDDTVIVL